MSEIKPPGDQENIVEVITYTKPAKKPRVGTLRMLMRMALGGAVMGQEELLNRFQEKQSQTQVPAAELNRVTPLESEADRVRYAILGAVANSNESLLRSVSKLNQGSNRSYGRLTKALEPISGSRFLKPFRRRYERLIDHGDELVSNWIAVGRREEYLSRQLTQEIATESIEETLDYLADSPELDELMAAQSMDLVDDIFVDEIRESYSNTSLILTEWFSKVILRRKGQATVASATISDEKPGQEQGD